MTIFPNKKAMAGLAAASSLLAAPALAGEANLASQGAALQAALAPHLPPFSLPGLGSLPAIEIRSLLLGLHLIGFCFGLGGATMLDFWVLRWMRYGRLPADVVRTFEFLGKVVAVGLILLWISGIGFLLLYAAASPDKLANPKIVAKLTIVVALSLNGLVVHHMMLPQIARSAPLPLLQQENLGRRILFIVSGALSGVSWYSAFALGLLHEFNGRIPADRILAIWLTLVIGVSATTGLCLLLTAFIRNQGGGMGANVA